jgi:hypothetical protein
MIKNYNDFIKALLEAGFSGAIGGKDDGVFGLFRYGWGAEDESSIHWHTGDSDTDPWEWRVRVLDERDDIAYSKVFFKKAGYITKEWYPYFLAARRGNKTFEDEYSDGTISNTAKRIYEVVAANDSLPLHEIKELAGFSREDKSKFDGALTELQMKLYLTMRGVQQKLSLKGEGYGWASTVFCTTEYFWGESVFEQAENIGTAEATDKITERVLKLNPSAQEKKIIKFIKG